MPAPGQQLQVQQEQELPGQAPQLVEVPPWWPAPGRERELELRASALVSQP